MALQDPAATSAGTPPGPARAAAPISPAPTFPAPTLPAPVSPAAGPAVAGPATSGAGAWTAFLAMAFAVVGLTGVLGTFAAQIPLERALARDSALDQALIAARGPDPVAALDRLRPELGDSADAVLAGGTGPGGLDARVAAERETVNRAFLVESADTGFRLRIVICVFTAVGALFGAMVLSVVRRSR